MKPTGGPEDALARGRRQLSACRTDACVVNGPAYGSGFEFLTAESSHRLADKSALSEFLARWTLEKISRR